MARGRPLRFSCAIAAVCRRIHPASRKCAGHWIDLPSAFECRSQTRYTVAIRGIGKLFFRCTARMPARADMRCVDQTCKYVECEELARHSHLQNFFCAAGGEQMGELNPTPKGLARLVPRLQYLGDTFRTVPGSCRPMKSYTFMINAIVRDCTGHTAAWQPAQLTRAAVSRRDASDLHAFCAAVDERKAAP